jgi:hypothetical protein
LSLWLYCQQKSHHHCSKMNHYGQTASSHFTNWSNKIHSHSAGNAYCRKATGWPVLSFDSSKWVLRLKIAIKFWQ